MPSQRIGKLLREKFAYQLIRRRKDAQITEHRRARQDLQINAQNQINRMINANAIK